MAGSTTNRPLRSGCTRRLAALTGLIAMIYVGAVLRVLYTPPDVAVLVSLPMLLEFAAGVGWAMLSAFVTVTLIRGKARALNYTAWLFIGLIVYNVARWMFFVRADYDRQRLPFLLVITVITLLIPAAFVAAQPTENSGNGRKSED